MGVKIIRLAIDTGRMDLAAYALVLAAVKLKPASGDKPDGKNKNKKPVPRTLPDKESNLKNTHKK